MCNFLCRSYAHDCYHFIFGVETLDLTEEPEQLKRCSVCCIITVPVPRPVRRIGPGQSERPSRRCGLFGKNHRSHPPDRRFRQSCSATQGSRSTIPPTLRHKCSPVISPTYARPSGEHATADLIARSSTVFYGQIADRLFAHRI